MRCWFLWILLGCTVSKGADETPRWTQYGGPQRSFVVAELPSADRPFKRLWRKDLGPGTSGIVGDGQRLFTQYSVPNPKKPSEGEEIVVALDPAKGTTLWEHRTPVARLKGQESYSGDAIRPQATPALAGKRLCTLGYTGLLKCFDAASGKVQWEYDLVRAFDATPTQFGFAASPLVLGDRFIVHVGGKLAAVIAFEQATGKVAWKAKPGEPSYASPMLLREGTTDVIVQVTRDTLLGLDARDGSERWNYPLPKGGLTNVPTPLILPKQRLLISGQGVLGTRLLEITTDRQVKEVWKNDKVTFFYTNWVNDEATAYGAFAGFVGAIDLADGKELWRERGYQDANILRVGPETLLLRGDGRLVRMRMNRTGLKDGANENLLTGRTWTAPTVIGSTLYARSNQEIVAWEWEAAKKP